MSILRIGGLATGMDIDQMVSDLMKSQRARSDRLKQEKQLVEWQRSDYRSILNSLQELRSMAFNMKLQGTYLAKSASTSSADVLAATAGVAAAPGRYDFNVARLASGITRVSQSSLPEETDSGTGSVKNLAAQLAISGTITFTIEGRQVAGEAGRRSQVFEIDTFAYTINGLVGYINSYSDTLGVSASYDAGQNRFMLSTTGTGADYGINITSDPDGFLSDASGDGSNTLGLRLQTGALSQGLNAQYSFGDANLENGSNSFTVAGININLKGAGLSTVYVASNADAVYNSITAFINQYNKTLGLINTELSEDRYKDYLPLTDNQREKLTDSQEESWEAKARSGMLKNDILLSGVVGKIRSAMGRVVSSIASVAVSGGIVTHNNLASIGIVTREYEQQGLLYLANDGAYLKEAIQNDPEGVLKLFTFESENFSEKGIAQVLYSETTSACSNLVKKAGVQSSYSLYDDSILGKKLYSMQKQIDSWEERLKKIEDRYWKQFTALERAISQLNAQGSWITQQFGQG